MVESPTPPRTAYRRVTSLLNKLVPSNFDSISAQIVAIANESVQETDGRTLIAVILVCVDAAESQPSRAELYARLCRVLMERVSPAVQDEGMKDAEGNPLAGGPLFRKYLLNGLQRNFETALTPADGEEADQRTYVVGTVRFIGEIFKVKILTERILHECVKKLMLINPPLESTVKALFVLLKTAGALMDTSKARVHMDAYFMRIREWTSDERIPLRYRFILQDLIDLRERKWTPRTRREVSVPVRFTHYRAARPPRKAGESSNFGEINSNSKGLPMTFGPSSVFFGKKDNKRELLSKTSSSSNMFSLPSQTPSVAQETSVPSVRRRLILQPRESQRDEDIAAWRIKKYQCQ
ncbi:armadillo-type protein [Mycena leptocephala]|nr:armadillo-type protein [Mycena leptocephala]